MLRRIFVQAFVISASIASYGIASAQTGTWPDKQINWVSVSAPGGNSDVVSRVVGQKLSERVKIPVVIENRPGASGAIASAYVAKANPDGYTVLAGSIASNVIFPLIGKVSFDPARDFIPVAILGTNANVLVVPLNSPFRSVQDLITAARAAPGSISYVSPGIGSTQHMSGELLQKMAGLKLTHVPNARGSVLNDVMGGHVSMMFEGSSAYPQVDGGKVRALAVTSKQRLPQFPNIPTMVEAGVKGFEVTSWQALYVPAGTPKAIADKLNQEILAVIATPEMASRFQQMGLTASSMSPAEFASFQRAEIAKWSAVVKDGGIKLD